MSNPLTNDPSLMRKSRTIIRLLMLSLTISTLIFALSLAAPSAYPANASHEQSTHLMPEPFAAARAAAGKVGHSLVTVRSEKQEPGAAAPREILTPRMSAALEHVARRYRVSSEALHPIFQAAQSTAQERQLDPLLIVAIIGIESGFNPLSESSMGAIGLMQVIPRFHLEKLPSGSEKSHFLDPVINIRVGSHVLEESIRRNGDLIAGLQQFGGAINDEGKTYASKVLAEKERLEQAVRRRASSS